MHYASKGAHMTHSTDDSMLRESENWLAKKSHVAKTTFRDMGKWTDRQAKYILSNIDSLAQLLSM